MQSSKTIEISKLSYEKPMRWQAKCIAALSVFQNIWMSVSGLAQKNTATFVADLYLTELPEDKLDLELRIIFKTVMFINVEGMAKGLSVDSTKHILKEAFMPDFAISAIEGILLYKLPGNTDSVSIGSTALLALLAEPDPGKFVSNPVYKAKH